MKKKYIKLSFFILFGGFITMSVYSLTPNPIDALNNIEIWIYRFKTEYNRIPVSLDDLINNTPSDKPLQIKQLFASYIERNNYIFDFLIINNIKIRISIKYNNFTYALEEENGQIYYYINEYLVMEYFRDKDGDVSNFKEGLDDPEEYNNYVTDMLKRLSENN